MFPPAKSGKRWRLLEPAGTDLAPEVPEAADPVRARSSTTSFFGALVQDARTSSAESIPEGEDHRAFYRLPVAKRVVIMLGGPFVNLVLGVLFTGIVLVGFGVAEPTTTIAQVSQCVVPATAVRQTCAPGDERSPAAAAGLRQGDRVVAVDGRPVTAWTQVTDVIRRSTGVPIDFTVVRNGVRTEVTVTPRQNTVDVAGPSGAPLRDGSGQVVTQTVGFIGVVAGQRIEQQPVTAVLPAVWSNVSAVGGIVIDLPQRIVNVAQAAFGSGARDPNGPISVVGVGRAAGEIASATDVPFSAKVASILGILGSLNIALFVFNLIPLLPLDGGHVIGALWEGLRRAIARVLKRRDPGPVDTAKLMPLTFAVAILLGGMSLLLIYADIVHPISIL
jgi:membrane-associated protease RseP (regulator of RpoE activity)